MSMLYKYLYKKIYCILYAPVVETVKYTDNDMAGVEIILSITFQVNLKPETIFWA